MSEKIPGRAKIGVYVCHCGTNISGKVDVTEAAKFAETLPGVAIVREYKFMCSDPGQLLIEEDIEKLGLQRVVVASCSPLMHESTFRGACERAHLNRYLFQMANIREHCSWVTVDGDAATEKAKVLLAGAVARARQLVDLPTDTVLPVGQKTLIVGAGIAGIQAALDIAESGREVYLVEKDSSIGGHMAKFDKTFPTLDCAACILTPKMVQVGKHKNIHLMSYAEVEKVTGFVGNFKVTVRQKPRFVDVSTCTGCGACTDVCPVEVPYEFEEGMTKRKAIYRNFPQAVPSAFVIDHPKDADCVLACPIEQDVQGYVTLIAKKKYKEAHELIRRTNPLPSVCTSVCNKACEGSCHRRYVDEPIAIRALKGFAIDKAPVETLAIPAAEKTGKKVLVVGAGVAGLAAAHDLALQGHAVTVVEAGAEPGGALLAEFPEAKLPRKAWKQDLAYLARLGIDIKVNHPVAPADLDKELAGYDSVFVDVAETKQKAGEEVCGIARGQGPLKKVNLTEVATAKKRIKAQKGGAAVLQKLVDGKRAAQAIDNFLAGRPAGDKLEEPRSPTKPSDEEKARIRSEWEREERCEPADGSAYTEADAVREASRCIECGVCCGCRECAKVCEPKAIHYDMKETRQELEVGAILLTTGFKSFDAKRIPQYGYGRLPNVVTALEFERMNSASGPTGGRVVMANGEAPKSVGIIHCVGSRDESYNRHCSRVCCMYALKFAHLVKEKTTAEVYNFYIDMRCFGKGYEEFYQRLLEEDVRFIRGRAASVSDMALSDAEKGKLIVRVEDTLVGEVRRVPLDMVVLATGLEAAADSYDVAHTFAISRGKDGFFLEKHPKLAPVSTPTDGIFIAGACQGAKDIPDTVAQASGAAAQALSLMGKGQIQVDSATCMVLSEMCAGCRICNTLCPMSAISFDETNKKTVINDVLCKGCGTCAAACPSAAIVARHFTDEQIYAEIQGVLYDVRA